MPRYAKPALFVLCCLPLLWLTLRAIGVGPLQLGPNPVATLIHALGSWGFRLLLLTLCVSPAAVIWRKPALLKLRRLLGLFSFTYLTLHFLTWLILDQWLSWSAIARDIIKRPYITVGLAALLMLVPLAVTSTDRWLRRLGRRWHRLHSLIYPAAILGAIHFWWQVKADWREPLLYALILASLLAWRVAYRHRQTRANRQRTPSH